MNRWIVVIAFAVCTAECMAVAPYIGTNQLWLGTNMLEAPYRALVERKHFSGDTAYYMPVYYWTNIWAPNHQYANLSYSFDASLRSVIGAYLNTTNLADNAFDGHTNAPDYWTPKTLHDYLKSSFTNTDGTVGVGIYTNDLWMLTSTWGTSEWSIGLGDLVYTLTNRYTLSNVTYRTYGWVYSDGSRIVQAAGFRHYNDAYPSEWSVIGSLDWWTMSSIFQPVGFMFDWTETSGMATKVYATLGRTNTTALADNLSLSVYGATNYSMPTTEIIDVSEASTGLVATATNLIWDSGIFDPGDMVIVPGMSITNSETLTNATSDHAGDRLSLRLHIPGRLYSIMVYEYPTANIGIFSSREEINERMAILDCLRSSKASVVYTQKVDNVIMGGTLNADVYTNTWGNAITQALDTIQTNDTDSTPVAFTAGTYQHVGLFDRFNAYFKRSKQKLAYDPSLPGTNIGFTCNFYFAAKEYGTNFYDNGDGVSNGVFGYVSSTNRAAGETNAMTADIGTIETVPSWCSEPSSNNPSTSKGWITSNAFVVIVPDFQYATNGL